VSNKWILAGYAVLFFVVVSNYELYAENTYLVVLAAAVLSIAGIGAWVWSVQPKKKDE